MNLTEARKRRKKREPEQVIINPELKKVPSRMAGSPMESSFISDIAKSLLSEQMIFDSASVDKLIKALF